MSKFVLLLTILICFHLGSLQSSSSVSDLFLISESAAQLQQQKSPEYLSDTLQQLLVRQLNYHGPFLGSSCLHSDIHSKQFTGISPGVDHGIVIMVGRNHTSKICKYYTKGTAPKLVKNHSSIICASKSGSKLQPHFPCLFCVCSI